jgi:hypothetical protein
MSLMTFINDLGEDADLLVRSDVWLENERRETAAELDRCANELRAIQLAQRIKTALQQKNLVAVQELVRSIDGGIQDIVVRILDLPKAMRKLNGNVPQDKLDAVNSIAQVRGWRSDGYDVDLFS